MFIMSFRCLVEIDTLTHLEKSGIWVGMSETQLIRVELFLDRDLEILSKSSRSQRP